MRSNPLLRLGKYTFFPTSFVLYYDTYGFFKSIKVEMFFTTLPYVYIDEMYVRNYHRILFYVIYYVLWYNTPKR